LIRTSAAADHGLLLRRQFGGAGTFLEHILPAK
jgi:hypothetical protein